MMCHSISIQNKVEIYKSTRMGFPYSPWITIFIQFRKYLLTFFTLVHMLSGAELKNNADMSHGLATDHDQLSNHLQTASSYTVLKTHTHIYLLKLGVSCQLFYSPLTTTINIFLYRYLRPTCYLYNLSQTDKVLTGLTLVIPGRLRAQLTETKKLQRRQNKFKLVLLGQEGLSYGNGWFQHFLLCSFVFFCFVLWTQLDTNTIRSEEIITSESLLKYINTNKWTL